MDDLFDLEYFNSNEKGGIAVIRESSAIIRLLKFRDTYIKQIEPDFPNMICTQVMYFEDSLSVRKIGKYLKHGGIGIGLWEYYNEDGTLNHTEDRDEHFPIKWEQMEEILKDKKISLLTADSIFRYYDEEKDEATWSIIIKLPMEKGQLYVFDARTGEIIHEEILDMRKKM